MPSKNSIFRTVATAAVLSPTFAFAATANPVDKSDNYNILLICLISLMVILLFVIGMLANTLSQLAYAMRDKMRKKRQDAANIVKTILLLIVFSAPAIHVFANETEKAVAPVSNYIEGIPVFDFYAIISVISLEFFLIFALAFHINSLLKIIADKPGIKPVAETIVRKSWFWDKFNAAASIEKEKDILLDHNYDGIQELDNRLPPWWKYGFYLTILVAAIYLYRFHISHDGQSQQEEYATEMQKGEEDKAAYLAQSANNIDENTVVLLTDASSIADGHELYTKSCIACHLADGGGIVGPNLTDDYWLHGGSIKDIFKSIKYGWQDKGMKSWKDDFSPRQMQELASFIKSLKGTHPATPKAPQGDLYIEATDGKSTGSANAKTGGTSGGTASAN